VSAAWTKRPTALLRARSGIHSTVKGTGNAGSTGLIAVVECGLVSDEMSRIQSAAGWSSHRAAYRSVSSRSTDGGCMSVASSACRRLGAQAGYRFSQVEPSTSWAGSARLTLSCPARR
jgi:hypothetical protein